MPAVVVVLALSGVSLLGWAVYAWAAGRASTARRGASVPREKAEGTWRAAQDGTPVDGGELGALQQVKVILVGPQGSGKTMQLAPMHHGITIGEDGVRLHPYDRTFQALGRMVSDISSPNPVLPGGNPFGVIDELDFQVQAQCAKASAPSSHSTWPAVLV